MSNQKTANLENEKRFCDKLKFRIKVMFYLAILLI